MQEEVTVFICYFENRKYNRRPSGARATGHCEESHHGGVLQLTPVERIPGWQSERPLHLQTAADSARGSRASLRKAASLAEALERRSLRELNQTEPIGSDMSSPRWLEDRSHGMARRRSANLGRRVARDEAWGGRRNTAATETNQLAAGTGAFHGPRGGRKENGGVPQCEPGREEEAPREGAPRGEAAAAGPHCAGLESFLRDSRDT